MPLAYTFISNIGCFLIYQTMRDETPMLFTSCIIFFGEGKKVINVQIGEFLVWKKSRKIGNRPNKNGHIELSGICEKTTKFF